MGDPALHVQPGPGRLSTSGRARSSPWTVLLEIARFLDSRPELTLQILLFTVFSLPLYALVGRSRERRMWGATIYLIRCSSAFVLLPILALGRAGANWGRSWWRMYRAL